MATTINDILQEIRLKAMSEREKGTDFERVMKWWFLTDPRYAELEKVWLWEEFPARKDFGGKDLGIDLVARRDNGDYYAIQCKCYAEDATLTRADSLAADSTGLNLTITLGSTEWGEPYYIIDYKDLEQLKKSINDLQFNNLGLDYLRFYSDYFKYIIELKNGYELQLKSYN